MPDCATAQPGITIVSYGGAKVVLAVTREGSDPLPTSSILERYTDLKVDAKAKLAKHLKRDNLSGSMVSFECVIDGRAQVGVHLGSFNSEKSETLRDEINRSIRKSPSPQPLTTQ